MYISSDLLLISGGLVTRKLEAREVLSATKLNRKHQENKLDIKILKSNNYSDIMKHYIYHSKYKWLFLTMCICCGRLELAVLTILTVVTIVTS